MGESRVTTFRTSLDSLDQRAQIDYNSKLLSLGSCFASEMGNKLKSLKFQCIVNPYGILYNPMSIARLLDSEGFEAVFTADTVVTKEGRHYHLNAHSNLSGQSPEELMGDLARTWVNLQQAFTSSSDILLTWGSAFVYQWLETGDVVANCHKQAATKFQKRLLTPEEILGAYRQLFAKYPQKRFLLTVSPIRHLRDSLELNSVSKSLLRYLCYTLTQEFNHVRYFPSYEIILDDLRDYRFYREDMLHPSSQALDYIWDIFSRSCLTPSSLDTCRQWMAIARSLQHRPFNEKSSQYLAFLEGLRSKLQKIPIDVREELETIEAKISALVLEGF